MVLLLYALAGAALLMWLLVRWAEPRLAFFPTRGESETPRDSGVPFEAVTIDTSDGEHLRGWVMPAPAPRANVVYFHGNGANLSNWSPILASIVKRGYSVFAFDYRGYGQSTGHPTERGLYRDVEAVVKQANLGQSAAIPTIYWGRSLGAAMAGYAATVRPPDGIILESGFANARAAVRSSPILLVLSFLSSYRFPAAEFVNRANRPVLVIHGNRDSVIPFALGQELFETLRVPKQFVVIQGGDHNDDVPRDAQVYWSAIDHFSDGLQPRPK
ncbi:MAG: alpha/beta hydrolase [Vicinamibacterales bacterium]